MKDNQRKMSNSKRWLRTPAKITSSAKYKRKKGMEIPVIGRLSGKAR